MNISSYRNAQFDEGNKTVRAIFYWFKSEGGKLLKGGQIGHHLTIVPTIGQRAVLLSLECVCVIYTSLTKLMDPELCIFCPKP